EAGYTSSSIGILICSKISSGISYLIFEVEAVTRRLKPRSTMTWSIPAMLRNYKFCFGVWLEALRILDEQVLINNSSESRQSSYTLLSQIPDDSWLRQPPHSRMGAVVFPPSIGLQRQSSGCSFGDSSISGDYYVPSVPSNPKMASFRPYYQWLKAAD
ncbi:Hypothetical predicted protein, partial [Olea europaea subsp. europaea]